VARLPVTVLECSDSGSGSKNTSQRREEKKAQWASIERSARTLIVVDNPFQTVPKRFLSEIHQQAQRKIENPQIGKNLFDMNGRSFFGALDFDQQFVVHDDVSSKRGIKTDAAIRKRYRPLRRNGQPLLFELACQYVFVDAFQHAGTKIAVDAQTSIDSYRCNNH
jgi:hypothetical protein